MQLHRAVVALLGAAVCVPAQAPSPEAFAFAPATLGDAFGNALGDRLSIEVAGSGVRASGRIGERDLRIDATATDDGFAGTARLGDGEPVPCTGRLDGESLLLRIDANEWRMRSEVATDAALTDLGEPLVDPDRAWTIAIHLAGDSDLEGAAINDLLEMQRGMPAAGCEVLVLVDRHRDADDGAEDWSDTRILRVRPGDDGNFENLAVLGERDSGNATTLASFVTGVFRKFPARRHAVFLWDHGGGWTGMCIDRDAPGRTGRTMLDLQAIRTALRTALQRSMVLQLDLLAFDACMMAQLDVVLAVHDLADVMVASEAEVPGSGFPYAKVLPRFLPEATGREIARGIVEEYGSFSDTEFESGSTLCAFDLRRAAGAAAGLDALARQALEVCDAQWHAIARALFHAECYQPRQQRIADGAAASIDLLDLSSRLRDVPGIDGTLVDALQLQAAAMIAARYSGAERTLSKGLAIYGPHRQGQYDADYDRTPLGRGNAWRRLLQRVHELAAQDASEVAVGDLRQLDALGAATAVARPFGGERLVFSATGNSIVEVQLRDWQYDTGLQSWVLMRAQLVTDPLWPARWATAAAADMIDLVMPQFVAGRNELSHELSGLAFAVTDGALQAYGSIDMATPSTQAPFHAIARYTAKAGGEPLLVEVAFDRAEWNMVSVRPLGSPEPGTLARTPVPEIGDTFEFWLMTRGDDGAEGGIFTPALTMGAQGIALVAEPDDPGRYRAELTARTFHGRTGSANHDYEIVANADLDAWRDGWKEFDPADAARLRGRWAQFKVVGPQQYQDLKTICEVEPTDGANLYRVLATGGPTGSEFETRQFWNFEWRGMPCLRIVTLVADGQKFGWYGPVRLFERDGQPVMAMKAVNASGVVWEWRKL